MMVHPALLNAWNAGNVQNVAQFFGRNIPCALSVRIDALTGEQVGDIYLDTPPVEDYGFTAIILWK